jgi:hypothetical protein
MVGWDFCAIRVENPFDSKRMLPKVRIWLAHRREMRLDLALNMAPKAKFVLLMRKILDIDDDLAAFRRRRGGCSPALICVTMIWFGRSIKG